MSTETQQWTRSNETWLKWTDKAADLCVAMEDAKKVPACFDLRQAMHEYMLAARYAEIPKNHKCLAYLSRAIAGANGSDRQTMLELVEDIVGAENMEEGGVADVNFWNRSFAEVMADLGFLEHQRAIKHPVSILEKRRAMSQQEQTEAMGIELGVKQI